MEILPGSLYDHPRYYDLVFGSDWRAELAFLEGAFARFAPGRVRSVFEPACGTGRLLFRLARAGYRVSGLDLNEHAVAWCNARLARHGYPPTAFVGDMTDFTLPRPVDAAINPINSFRHLTSDQAARRHLEAVARALRPGGLYVLALHLTPLRGEALDEESWSARRGHLAINVTLQSLSVDRRRREERCRLQADVYTPTRRARVSEEIVFRTYTARQMAQLLASVPAFQIAGAFDFHYRLDEPIQIDAATQDVVYVLKKGEGEGRAARG